MDKESVNFRMERISDWLHSVEKPWGYEIIIGEFQGWTVKLLHVEDGHRTSQQYHEEKEEYWFHQNGKVEHMFPWKVHRLTGPIEVLEVAFGDDEDIIRLEDDYGRASKRPTTF